MNKTGKRTKKDHSLISAIVVTFVLLLGLSLLLYPTAADYVNSLDYKRDIEGYQRVVKELDDSEREKMLADASDFNERLLKSSLNISALGDERRKEYNELLNPSGSGIMGYVEIEKANIYLPIYHGTEESVLQAGVGHIEGSSLPVGGTGTHTILSGHTGLPSSKLFSNIDKLEIGDTFEIHILGEILTYRVESVTVVLPSEAEKQKLDPNKDICTLMTCTPYGVNSHRLLVTGARIETPVSRYPENETEEKIPAPIPPVLWITGIVLTVIIIAVTAFAVRKKRSRKGGAR